MLGIEEEEEKGGGGECVCERERERSFIEEEGGGTLGGRRKVYSKHMQLTMWTCAQEDEGGRIVNGWGASGACVGALKLFRNVVTSWIIWRRFSFLKDFDRLEQPLPITCVPPQKF